MASRSRRSKLSNNHSIAERLRVGEQLDVVHDIATDLHWYDSVQHSRLRRRRLGKRPSPPTDVIWFANIGSVEDMPMSTIRSQLDTDFLGSAHVIKAVLLILREQGDGRIVQVSSTGARIATPGAAAYYAGHQMGHLRLHRDAGR